MRPKEKAIELVSKYKNAPFNCIDCEMLFCDIKCTMLSNEESKQCALIVVDEILNSWHPVNIHCGHEFHHDNLTTSFYEYWEEIKEEIINL